MDSNSKSEFLYDKLHFFLTTKQKDELKHAFDLLDDKGSGVIDIEDIVIIVHSLDLQVKPGSVSKLLRRYDPHNSGALDFRGFLCVVEKLLFSKFTNDDIYKAFKAYCKSRGDAILLEDLKLINKDLNEDLSDEELNARCLLKFKW